MATIAEPGERTSLGGSRAEAPFSARLRGSRLVPLIVLASFAPLVFWHLVGLLQKAEYQYLIILPLAAWALASGREVAPTVPRRKPFWAGVLALVSALGGAFAAWFWSPWVGTVSALIAVIPCLWWVGGWPRVKEWLPVWVLCLLLVPIPFGWDTRLVQSLRTVTTRAGSAILDELGVLHLYYANVIELPGKKLFIADACSGIHSLFVLMGASLFLGLWFKRRIIHIVLLLNATFGIVLIENISRLIAVALAWRSGVDLTEGTPHAMLGFVLFLISLLIIVSTDQLLVFLVPEAKAKAARATQASGGTGWSAGQQAIRGLLGTGWVAASAVIFVLGLVSMPKNLPELSTFTPSKFDMAPFGAGFLPKNLAGYDFSRFSEVKRVVGDPFGTASQQWEFRKGDVTVYVSVDYPYTALHDLTDCFRAIGWRVPPDESAILAAGDLPEPLRDGETGSLATALLNKDLQGNGFLVFSLVDASGEPAVLLKSGDRTEREQSAANRLKSFQKGRAKGGESAVRFGGDLVQFQLFAVSPAEFTSEQKTELLAVYLAARRLLLPKSVEALRKRTSAPTAVASR